VVALAVIRLVFLLSGLCALLVIAACVMGHVLPAYDFLSYIVIPPPHWTSELFVYDPVYRLPVKVTHDLNRKTDLTWSDTGFWAFISEDLESGFKDIFILNAYDFALTRVTQSYTLVDDPAWSPDGRLSYTDVQQENMEIYLYDPNTRQSVNLTKHPADDLLSTWTPDGDLAFISNRSGNAEVYRMDVATRQVTVVTHQFGEVSEAKWSETGEMAFTANRAGSSDVYILDGQKLLNASSHSALDGRPQWSNDGHLAFLSYRTGEEDVFVYDPETGQITNVTQHPAADFNGNWSRDGRLAFISQREPVGVYILNAHSAELVARDAVSQVWWRWP
jgi:TolB protein